MYHCSNPLRLDAEVDDSPQRDHEETILEEYFGHRKVGCNIWEFVLDRFNKLHFADLDLHIILVVLQRNLRQRMKNNSLRLKHGTNLRQQHPIQKLATF